MKHLFTEHPASVNETYLEHLVAAGGFGVRMLFGSLVCLVHAVLPFAFERTGSQIITVLHDRMVANRIRNRAQQVPAQERQAA